MKFKKLLACIIFRIGCFCEQSQVAHDPVALMLVRHRQWKEYNALKKAFDKTA
jgi:hypothetical protein